MNKYFLSKKKFSGGHAQLEMAGIREKMHFFGFLL